MDEETCRDLPRATISLCDLPWDAIRNILLQRSVSFADACNLLRVFIREPCRNGIDFDEFSHKNERDLWETKFKSNYSELYFDITCRYGEAHDMQNDSNCAQSKQLDWSQILDLRSQLNQKVDFIADEIRRKCLAVEMQNIEILRDNLVRLLMYADPDDVRYPVSDRERDSKQPILSQFIVSQIPGTQQTETSSAFEILPRFGEGEKSNYLREPLEISRQASFPQRIFYEVIRECSGPLLLKVDGLELRIYVDVLRNFIDQAQEHADQSLLKYARIARFHLQKLLALRELPALITTESPIFDIFFTFMQGIYPACSNLTSSLHICFQKLVKQIRIKLYERRLSTLEDKQETFLDVLEEINLALQKSMQNHKSPIRLFETLVLYLGLHFGIEHLPARVGHYIESRGFCTLSFLLLAEKLGLSAGLLPVPVTIQRQDSSIEGTLTLPCIFEAERGFVVFPSSRDSHVVVVPLEDIPSRLPDLIFQRYFADVELEGFGCPSSVSIEFGSKDVCLNLVAPRDFLKAYLLRSETPHWMDKPHAQPGYFYGQNFLPEFCVAYWFSLPITERERSPEFPVARDYLRWTKQTGIPLNTDFFSSGMSSYRNFQQGGAADFVRYRSNPSSTIPWQSVLPVGSVVRYRKRALVPEDHGQLRSLTMDGVIINWELTKQLSSDNYQTTHLFGSVQTAKGSSTGKGVTDNLMGGVAYYVTPICDASMAISTRFYSRDGCAGGITGMEFCGKLSPGVQQSFEKNSNSPLWKYFERIDSGFFVPNKAMRKYFPDDAQAQNLLRLSLV